MGTIIMTSDKVRNINQIMLRDLRDSIKAGRCTTQNTSMAAEILQRIAQLTDKQILLISDKFSMNLLAPISPEDKDPSVFWEDMVYFCEEGNDAELQEMIDRLEAYVKLNIR